MQAITRSPLGLRIANTLLLPLQTLKPRFVDLNPDALLREARKRSGLQQLAEPESVEALSVLTTALDTEARLTPLGRVFAKAMLLGGIEHQLRLQQYLNRHPEIKEHTIDSPIVIVGMPRTGTTILHELMALDPDNRIPQAWEVAAPFPPPESASYHTDPRIAEETKRLRLSHHLMPGVENMHRMGAQLPQECVAITADVFTSMLYTTIFHIPSYAEWLESKADMAMAYRYHHRMLRLLQWQHPAKRWVLKSPGHLWTLEALLHEYPNAKLIQTHRDPLKIVSSLASMLPTMRCAYQNSSDSRDVAAEWALTNSRALNASMQARDAGIVPSKQIIDIQFGDFMASPKAAVRAIYEQFDLVFTDQFAAAIDDYIEQNPADKHGGHKHRFSDTGLTIEAERERVAAYQQYFGVQSEQLS